MLEEDMILCEKGEWLRRRLCAVNDGKIVHEACRIGNYLCNYVPMLSRICDELNKISKNEKSNWNKDEAEKFYTRVKTNLKKAIDEAICFCKEYNID